MPKRILVNRSLGLYRRVDTGIYYFRKFHTAAGRAEISLRTKDRDEAEKIILRTYAEFLRLPERKQKQTTCIDEIVAEIYEINQGKSARTFESFEGHCRLHLLPYFTGFSIDKVAAAWPVYIAHQQRLNPSRQLTHDRKHLITILKRAVVRGDLVGMPELPLDRGKRIKQRAKPYTSSEVRMILNATPEQVLEKAPSLKLKRSTLEKIQLQIELALFSGLRMPHEVNSLRYSDIDFQTGVATIRPENKTRTGRECPIDLGTLGKILKRMNSARVQSDFVFPKRGQPYLPATGTDKSWQRFKRAMGLEKKRYWFRHSHASAALREVSAPTVQRNMGTSAQMIEQIYNIPSREELKRQSSAVRRFYQDEIGENGELGGTEH